MKIFNWVVQAACDPTNPFGCIEPPANPNAFNGDPAAQTATMLTLAVRLVLTVGALTSLTFLLWGGFDWITSQGDKEKIQKAQRKITYALLGLIFLIVALGIFGIIAGNVLGIIQIVDGTIIFNLPTYSP